jgi:transposase, IS30 family
MKGYTHLSSEERETMYVLLHSGSTQAEVGKALGRPGSTISRERKRNRSLLHISMNNNFKAKADKTSYHYLPDRAQKKTETRRLLANQRPFLKTLSLYKYVREELGKGTSPELIAGRAALEGRGQISHECIYQYIYSFGARTLKLWESLPRAHRKRKRRTGGRKQKRVLIPNRVDISRRPKEVMQRKTFGHWEGDSVLGKGKGAAVNTNRERISRFVLFTKLPRKTALYTLAAEQKRFLALPPRARKTLTTDNGTEFISHQTLTISTGMRVYFAHPYHSWERGTNENGNGLLRRFFPKGTDFNLVSAKEIQKVEDWVNHRPMKCLNYHTPYEVFHSLIKSNPHKIALAN